MNWICFDIYEFSFSVFLHSLATVDLLAIEILITIRIIQSNVKIEFYVEFESK